MSFFYEFLDKAKTTGSMVEKQGKQMAKIAKLKFRLNETSIKIDKEYNKIGEFYYNIFKFSDDYENELKVCIDNIDDYVELMIDIKGQINDLEKCFICNTCGSKNKAEEQFCKKCGNSLE